MGDRTAGERSRGPAPAWIGRCVEPVYAAVIARRNAAFDAGKGVSRIDRPVISVGNLSVGGTGKTPMVMHIVGTLLRVGRTPCIAMRGYGRASPPTATGSPAAPDETDSYQRAFPGLAIVAQPDRTAGLRALLAREPAVDCVVLDDGFQHRKLARDLDIVLIDATRPFTRDRLLPAGWLREAPASLKRASMVVLTHAELASPAKLDGLEREVTRWHGKPPAAVTRHLWTGLIGAADDSPRPLDTILGKRVVAACAIGNPDAFLASLEATLAPTPLAGSLVLQDHDPFAPATVDKLIRLARSARAEVIIVTDKDWSKLRRVPASAWPCPVVRPMLSLAFDRGQAALESAVLGVARAVVPAA